MILYFFKNQEEEIENLSKDDFLLGMLYFVHNKYIIYVYSSYITWVNLIWQHGKWF